MSEDVNNETGNNYAESVLLGSPSLGLKIGFFPVF